ncbi:MAG: bifunctional diguanylate cyclase/phosphodiesterase, partial [Candidatus Hydrogenedentota bacterium]
IIKMLQTLAYRDSLTGLSNRHGLLKSILDIRKRKPIVPHTIFILDIDEFSKINNMLGSLAADQLLQRVAIELKNLFPEATNIARISADEFSLLLYQQENEDPVHTVEKIRQKLHEIEQTWQQSIPVTGSIGIAHKVEKPNYDVLRHAELAVKEAKARGRNSYCIFEDKIADSFEREVAIETALKYADIDKEFHVVFQPQVEIHSGNIIGAELLLRWHHPRFGLISPIEFIPLAEKNDEIFRLGEFVFQKAMQAQEKISAQTGKNLLLSINISPRQWLNKNLLAEFLEMLHKNNLSPKHFEFEITETFLMKDPEVISKTIEQYKDQGMRFALDDFGSGYAGLQYLRDFPVDTIKIDRSFVAGITKKYNIGRILKLLQIYASEFGIRIVAEGAEQEEEIKLLKDIGIQYVQGFYYYPPLDFNTLLQKLSA